MALGLHLDCLSYLGAAASGWALLLGSFTLSGLKGCQGSDELFRARRIKINCDPLIISLYNSAVAVFEMMNVLSWLEIHNHSSVFTPAAALR